MAKGLCGCGCGQHTPLAPYTRRSAGWVQGQPKPFVNRSHAKNGPLSPAALSYHLAAFDAYLKADAIKRDDQPVADVKAAALEHLLNERQHDASARAADRAA